MTPAVRAYGERQYVTLGRADEGWTRSRAEEELELTLAAVKLGVWKPPARRQVVDETPETPTFWEFAQRWYADKELEVGERPREELLWVLNKHLIWFGRDLVGEITEQRVDDYRAFKLAEGRLCPDKINRTLQVLAKILDRAVKRGLLTSNPARGEDSRLKVKKPRRIWLELDEVASLLNASGDYRPELSTLILAGLRIGELGNLRWRAVDLVRGTLTVEQSKTSAGEGRKIDLTPMLLEELKLHGAAAATSSPDALVFPTSNGRQRTKDNSRGRLLTILKRANEARAEKRLAPVAHVTNHTLRRTFASLLYEAGENPAYVMDQMGHTSAQMALEVYARKMRRQRETGAKVDALVWARMGTNGAQTEEALAAKTTEDAV